MFRRTSLSRLHNFGNLYNSPLNMRSFHSKVINKSPYLAQPKTVAVIGAPMQLGQPKKGTDDGPSILRKFGLENAVKDLKWLYDDKGDVDMHESSINLVSSKTFDGNAHNCEYVGSGNERIMEKVKKSASEKSFVLTVGGDHSIGAGSVAGMLCVYPNLGVLWVDAHADINTPLTSGSGNMHGMPVGLVMKLAGATDLPGFDWLKDVPKLSPSQVAYVGLRDLDDGERKALRELEAQGMYVSTMYDVDALGIGKVMEYALESLGNDRPLHLSYDIDSLDPALAPSTGTRVAGGLNLREGHYVAETIAETGQLVSMDMVEVNSSLGNDEEVAQTTKLAVEIIRSALGSKIY